MPARVPQDLKSLKVINAQPQYMNNKIDVIMCMDLAGKGTGDIARELGMTDARISVIKHSPLYIDRIAVERGKLKEMYREKQTDKLTSGDPVKELLKGAALSAARKKIELMEEGKSEFVQLAAAGDVLDRAGYKSHEEKTKITVEVTEKMADRFEQALKFKIEETR